MNRERETDPFKMSSCAISRLLVLLSLLFLIFYHVIAAQMQAGDSVVGAPMGVTGTQSRSEDEDTLVIKDVKRTVTQAFGSGVPKRRSSNRSEFNLCFMLFVHIYTNVFCLLTGIKINKELF